MSLQVIWSKDASDELIEIITYAKVHYSPKTASDIYKNNKEKLEVAKTIPDGGREVPELISIGVTGIREVIEKPWRIFSKKLPMNSK